MKWVVISLLLLNSIFLAVQLSKEEQTELAVERFPLGGSKLVLLAEKEMQDKAKQLVEKNQPVPAVKTTSKPVKKAVAVAKAGIEDKSPVIETVPAPKPRPKPQSQPVIAPAAKPAPKPVPTPIAKSKSAAMACYSVGPFLLISDVKVVSQLFGSSAIIAQERSEALRKQVGYWVYIPPAGSSQLAQGVKRQLINNDVSDAVIISEGTKANAISVGVFKTEALGKRRQSFLVQLGYEANIEPLFRNQPQYWLDLELMNITQLPEKLWREVTAGYPKIKQMRRKCE